MSGSVVAVMITNVPAMRGLQRVNPNLDDLSDFGDVFPGRDRFATERIAAAVSREVQRVADCFVDLHTGGDRFQQHPFVMYTVAGKVPADRYDALARGFGVPTLWRDEKKVFANDATTVFAEAGIPAFLLEVGGGQPLEAADIRLQSDAVRSLLRTIGVLPGGAPAPSPRTVITGYRIVTNAEGRLLRRGREAGRSRPRGVGAGRIYDAYGDVAETLTAPAGTDIVLGVSTYPAAATGGWLFELGTGLKRERGKAPPCHPGGPFDVASLGMTARSCDASPRDETGSVLLLVLLVPGVAISTRSGSPPRHLRLSSRTSTSSTSRSSVPADMSVTLDGDHIADVAPSGSAKPPDGARVVDGSGKFLIPGLWDMHIHTFFGDWVPGGREVTLPLLLANGVTGVRDMGSELDPSSRRARTSRPARLLGPRIVVSGPDARRRRRRRFRQSSSIATPEDGRAAVDAQERGVDFIKIQSLVPRDAYFAIADEARSEQIVFDGHVPDAIRASRSRRRRAEELRAPDRHLRGQLTRRRTRC